jgi:hypothetical protein
MSLITLTNERVRNVTVEQILTGGLCLQSWAGRGLDLGTSEADESGSGDDS